MANFLWWRSWHGAPTDLKWPVIAAKSGVKVGIVSAIAWALLDHASQQKDRGSIEGFDIEAYAIYSGFTEEDIEKVIQAMIDKKMIINGRFTKWEERQPKREDDSTERVQRYRENTKIVTQCNAEKRNVTQGNAPEKRREDKDKEHGADAPSEADMRKPEDKTILAAYGVNPNQTAPLPDWVPPDTQTLCREFIDTSGIKPTSREKAYWIKCLRQQREIGLSPGNIHEAILKMRHEGLTIKDPGSVTAVARDLRVKPDQVPAASEVY